MNTSTARACAVPAVVLLLAASVLAKTSFSSVWKSPEAAAVGFAGKTVAALVIDKDDSLRVAGEEALASELTARGMMGIPSYRFVPKEELVNAERARPWFERAGAEGVIALRVVNDDKRRIVQPAMWTTSNYTTLWGYYGYGWASVYEPGYTRDERIVSLETLIFSVSKNALLWAGLSTTENPKDPRSAITEVVKEAVKEMREQGLARSQKK